MASVLPPEWFSSKDAEQAARGLLGKVLCVEQPDGTVLRRRITETEAYLGEDDTAAHARFGHTARNLVLYEPSPRVYVYRCYMYWLLNITVGADDDPQCVLIRGVEGADGPGRTSKLMGFAKDMYGSPVVMDYGLWVEDDGTVPENVEERPRVGIPYASDEDREAKLNFRWANGARQVPEPYFAFGSAGNPVPKSRKIDRVHCQNLSQTV